MAESRKALPQPTEETLPYWEACSRGELQIQFCNDCRRYYFYPRPLCRWCLSRDTEWRRVSGRGRLHTHVINNRPARGFEDEVPYVIAIIELDEGPRLMSNLTGVKMDLSVVPSGLRREDGSEMRLDDPVQVYFEKVNDEITLPKFRPA